MTLLCTLLLAPAASADTAYVFASPSDDRWHYPFNASPGTRATGSTFGSTGDLDPLGNPRFNDRDGTLIIGWNTTTQIAPDQGPEAYHVKAVRVTVTSEGGAEWPVDLTADDWFTYDVNADGMVNGDGFPRGHPMDTDGESDDVDVGRPFELFGTGFGPDAPFDELTWTETSIFIGWNQQPFPVARNPFPFVYQNGTLEKLHVEDNVKGLHNDALPTPVFQFTPVPWATGEPVGYVPGATPDPFDVVFEIDLDLSCGAVRDYFAGQLDTGRVIVTITSLFETFEQAPSGFPSFFLNNPGGNPHPAELLVVLSDHPLGDIDGDGDVDEMDVAMMVQVLLDPDAATPEQQERADLNGNGAADGGDLQTFVVAFLGGC